MDLGLTGKVAMVAAASKGIGFATAKLLAAEGCLVSICARNEEALEAAAAEIGEETRSYIVDVSNADDLAWWTSQTREDLGEPSILVTNTGGPKAAPLSELEDADWQGGIDSTLMNVVRLVRLVQPSMAAAGWGRIVHVTSLVAREPNPLLPISSTLRSGLLALTKLQALEVAAQGVTVNAVLPGHTRTDRQAHIAQVRADRQGISLEQSMAEGEKDIPTGRFAEPEEVAAAIAFLCGRPAASITGQSLLVDGGIVKGI
jgi:3-oxoacyl-[acyl-carrier protein] reductase